MVLPTRVAELIDRFRRNQKSYEAATYREANLRTEFLDPLLDELGWDIRNRKGYAETYKEVVVEHALDVDGSQRAPDYAFRIGGVRKFFLEAKSPSPARLKGNGEAAFQVRRYGWSAKLPLSILTNFREWAVYDCRIKPVHGEPASRARIDYFTIDELDERWADLAGTFSYEGILKGAFDKYATDGARGRGTAEVDAAFLADVEAWREILARNIALRNSGLSVRELNTAVQRTIDRIVFLRIAEDRGLEPYGKLRGAAEGPKVYQALTRQFREADERYNSGLFHFSDDVGQQEHPDAWTLTLGVDDRALKPILKGLYYPESPYAFSVLPADILGQVYEQFLGKVIRLKGRSAVVEEKPEVRKAGGVFYTPTYIVQEIVRDAVDPLLAGKTPAQVAGQDQRMASRAPLRILDPACGSGSFLIEAYQHLLDWYLAKYVKEGAEKHARGANPKVYRSGRDGAGRAEWRLSIAERRRILLDHIYGVDIDEQAVEVTKLSLLLKLLEGQKSDVVGNQINLFNRRALPDLGANIKSGNSLIDSGFYTQRSEAFSEEERIRLNAFDWDEEFPFRFDAVVGNPPYGANLSGPEKAHLQTKYVCRKGKPETYLFFVEKGLQLLTLRGRLGYIIPNAWLTNFYGKQMRTFILSAASVEKIVDLEPVRVFKAATVDTCIVVLEATPSRGRNHIAVARASRDGTISPQFKVTQASWRRDAEKVFNVYADGADLRVAEKLASGGRTLGEIVEYSQGVIPYLTKAEGAANRHISTKPQTGWRPLLESAEQVRPYAVQVPAAYINYGSQLNRAREPRFFDQPKILFHRVRKKLPRQLVGAIDETGAVNRHSLSNLILRPDCQADELWAALAVFNSQLANWWFVKRYGPLMEVAGFKVEMIPLPGEWQQVWPRLASEAKKLARALATAVNVRDGSRRTLLEREVRTASQKIETLIFESFGLDSDEVKYVRSSFAELVARASAEAAGQEGALEVA